MSKEENSAKTSPQWILLQQNSAQLILIECKAVQWELDIAYIQQSMTKLEKTIPKRLPKEIKLWIIPKHSNYSLFGQVSLGWSFPGWLDMHYHLECNQRLSLIKMTILKRLYQRDLTRYDKFCFKMSQYGVFHLMITVLVDSECPIMECLWKWTLHKRTKMSHCCMVHTIWKVELAIQCSTLVYWDNFTLTC